MTRDACMIKCRLNNECGSDRGTFYIYAGGAGSRDDKQAEEIMPLKDCWRKVAQEWIVRLCFWFLQGFICTVWLPVINGIWPAKNVVSYHSYSVSISCLPFNLFLTDMVIKKLVTHCQERKYIKENWEVCICLRESWFFKNIQVAFSFFKDT